MEKIALGIEIAKTYGYAERVEVIVNAVADGVITADEAIECIKVYAKV